MGIVSDPKFALALLVTLVTTAHAELPRSHDEHSFAEPAIVVTKNLALDLTVDFRAKQLVGTATLDLGWRDPTATQLVLDTRDLAIARVEAFDGDKWTRAKFTLGKRDPILGSKLTIVAPKAQQVRITYRTAPTATGLQWMDAKLTADGKHPFMFSQSQSIHARSWVPLQDTPGIRFTYTAHIRTPKDLVAVMSADNDPNLVRDGDYTMKMAQPIPSYLLAIAVGDLAFKPISQRCGVWAEPPVVDRAVTELADTEKMIATAEKLYGPYRWDRYDILLLPATFPFGGMENPRLSFITPTVLVGDKSLTSLIAHELAHSWSGNLVTNASWKDVWLNEGFTTYVEGRIVEEVYGKDLAEMELAATQADLKKRINRIPKEQQKLRLEPAPGSDPDGFGEVAYDKGQWFLYALEHRLGRKTFDEMLKKWFDQHAFTSVTTDDFLDYVNSATYDAVKPMIEDWVSGEGVPKLAPTVASKKLTAVDDVRSKWLRGEPLASAVVAVWTTQERIYFLDGLPDKLADKQLAELDTALALTGTTNGEYAQRWYPLTIRSGYTKARVAAVDFIAHVGRMKLVMPIWRAFAGTPDGLAFAKQQFARIKPNYHPLTAKAVASVLTARPARP